MKSDIILRSFACLLFATLAVGALPAATTATAAASPPAPADRAAAASSPAPPGQDTMFAAAKVAPAAAIKVFPLSLKQARLLAGPFKDT